MKLLCMEMEITSGNAVAFDSAACVYDEEFTNTPIGRLQRTRVLKFLSHGLKDEGLIILEINCGTGEDAIWLAGQGHNVTATDASAKMIEGTRQKIAGQKSAGKVSAMQLSFSDLKDYFSDEKFDLIFS